MAVSIGCVNKVHPPRGVRDTGKKIVFRTLGFNLSTLGSVPSNVFTVVLGPLNTFDGTDPKVDRLKPKVRNTIFFLCDVCA